MTENMMVKVLDVLGLVICSASVWTLYANQVSFIA